MSTLAVSFALNRLMNIYYAIQLTSGWTKRIYFINLFSAFIHVLLIILLTQLYGAVGTASVWVLVITGYILIAMPIVLKRL